MRLILRTDVEGVGTKGDVVDVADGFGRNYLVPQGLAMRSSDGAESQAAGMRAARAVQDSRDLEAAHALASQMTSTPLRIAARASDEGRLFGSVTAQDISMAAFVQASCSIDRKTIVLDDAIKDLGTHSVQCKPHTAVEFTLTVEVVADDS